MKKVNFDCIQTGKKLLYSSIFFLYLTTNIQGQNFPKLGNDTLLDIACWNIEWFGDPTSGNGPSDEATQFNNVKALLDKTEMDVFALEEISNATAYANLNSALAAKYDSYISTFSQTQKMGIYWRKSMFSILPAQSYNIALNSGDNYFFASRPPLQVALKTLGGSKTDTLYFLCVHMKAYADVDSYNRRVGAAAVLKTYIENNLAGKKYIVLGDWNDDLDVSIYSNSITPYKNLLDAAYTFPSKELTDQGKASYAFNTNMIDHILNSKTLDSFYYKNSARVFDSAPNYCVGFSNNTSDHFPVYASYNWQKLTTRIVPEGLENQWTVAQLQIYPNPASTWISIECDKSISSIKLLDLNGQIALEEKIKSSQNVKWDIGNLSQGIYLIEIETASGRMYRKLCIE